MATPFTHEVDRKPPQHMLPTVSQSSIKVAVGKDKQKNEEKKTEAALPTSRSLTKCRVPISGYMV